MQHPRSGEPDALLWPGRTSGSNRADYERVWDLASFRRNYFKPALTRAELPAIRVHDLRHTAASLWLAAGVPAVPGQPLARPRQRCHDRHDLLAPPPD